MLRKRKRGAAKFARVLPTEAPNGVYLPDALQLVMMIGTMGATGQEVEKVYGLGAGTLKKWRATYPSLDKALEQGRTKADVDVLCALYKGAVGFHEYEEQAVGGREPQVMKVKKYYPGQFLAQKHWLGQRQRDRWPATEKVQVTGTGKDGSIKIESRNEVIDAILSLVTAKTDPEKEKSSKESRAS